MAWGRGVGKSWFLRLVCYLLVSQWDNKSRVNALGKLIRGVRIVIVGPTIEQLKKVHGQETDAELTIGGDWDFLGAHISHDNGGWRISFPGGSFIQWVTAERARGARGIRCDVAILDEADDISIDTFDAVIQPWFSEPDSLKIQVVAGTPLKGRNGLLYRTYLRGVEGFKDHYSVHATYADAPETVSAAQVEIARASTTPELFAREWECDFDSAEALVYPAFKVDTHVKEPHSSAIPTEYVIGLDWGFVDPTAALLLAVYGNGNDSVAWILRESYRTGWTLDNIVALAKEWKTTYPTAKWFADASQPASIEFLRANAGINIQAASNRSVDRDDGIYAVNHWLTPRQTMTGIKPRLYVHPSCTNVIREFGLYRRKRNQSDRDRIMEKPEDKNDHAMDALRYGLFSRFGKPPAIRIETGQGK